MTPTEIPDWFRNIVAAKVVELLNEDIAADVTHSANEVLEAAVRLAAADVRAIGQEMLTTNGIRDFIAAGVHANLRGRYDVTEVGR